VSSKLADGRRFESLRKKTAMVELLRQGYTIDEACVELDMSKKSYDFWRYKDKTFVGAADRARAEAMVRVGMEPPMQFRGDKVFNFATEREFWFGHTSPWFQLEVIDAFERLNPGDILLVLLPPGHGKTTLYEDYVTLRLGHFPSLRNHIGSETQSLSKKILKRVRDRLDPIPGWSKMEEFRLKYGPFAPPRDERHRNNQAWTATHFDIWRKREFDERDFSMAALGFGSQIIGSRSDHLHVDDVQSMKTLNQTDKYIDDFSQDWLSRPLDEGITTIVGNRIDEGDFYEALIDKIPGDILKVIRYPALRENPQTHVVEPLWPERFTLEGIDKMRRKIGDIRFERNWMQRPRATSQATFDEKTIDKCLVPLLPLRSVQERTAHVVGLDPGYGVNAVVATRFDDQGMHVTHIQENRDLYNTNQVLGVATEVMQDIVNKGGMVTDFIIEDKAFQHGLLRDPQTERMQERFGFAIRGHQTGSDRNDENIGVPSMVHTMLRGEMHFPWGEDDYTRLWVGELKSQLLSWKPSKPGNKLRMDIVMALWFCWIVWRNRRGVFVVNPSDWKTNMKNPYPKTNGLVLPRGYRPVLTRR
jgi:hypothetical protein